MATTLRVVSKRVARGVIASQRVYLKPASSLFLAIDPFGHNADATGELNMLLIRHRDIPTNLTYTEHAFNQNPRIFVLKTGNHEATVSDRYTKTPKSVQFCSVVFSSAPSIQNNRVSRTRRRRRK